MTETVNALLNITDKENIVLRKALHDRILDTAVILILIDIDLIEKIPVIFRYFRIGKEL